MAKKAKKGKEDRRTLYAKVLGLKAVNPGPVVSFLFFEVTLTAGIVLALLGLIAWWGILVLPVTVAAMVKLNDLIVGATQRSAPATEQDFDRQPEFGDLTAPLEPVSEPPPPSGMSAAQEHRRALRERSRQEKRAAREAQKAAQAAREAQKAAQASRARRPATPPADPGIMPAGRPPEVPDHASTEHTQVLPVIDPPVPEKAHDKTQDATQQLPTIGGPSRNGVPPPAADDTDELDGFMSDIRGKRPPPWQDQEEDESLAQPPARRKP